MSASAKKIEQVQLTVSTEAASLIRALLYSANWSDFPEAASPAEAIDNLGIDMVDIVFNEDTAEFDRN